MDFQLENDGLPNTLGTELSSSHVELNLLKAGWCYILLLVVATTSSSYYEYCSRLASVLVVD